MVGSSKLLNVYLSVDNDEWYYGRPENRNDPSKRTLMKGVVREDTFISTQDAKSINEYYIWIEAHEKETVKKKKRPFYIDNGFCLAKF